uniref:Crystaline entomocidal protoxin n=1 Tax=Bacillus cereus TaxID=1396 RepID=A0A161ASZ9_BACCE|nr:Cry2-like protein [Bacillus cereus]
MANDINGIMYNCNGNGVMNDTSGVMNDMNGVMNDMNGVMNDMNGVMNDVNGVMNDMNGVMNDVNGVMNDTSGVMNDVNGVMSDTSGGQIESIPPINVLRIDPSSSDEQIEKAWEQWRELNTDDPTLQAIPIVASFILKKIGGMLADKLFKKILDSLFPKESPVTIKQVVEIAEQIVNQKLEAATRERVYAELEGLTNSSWEVHRDIEAYEAILGNNQDENSRIVNAVLEYDRTGVYSPDKGPKGIIDSLNSFNTLTVNRMPQFSVPTFALALLPLYAQAANTHLSFLRDVVDNADKWKLTAAQKTLYRDRLIQYTKQYSDHCIKTYKAGFNAKFPNESLRNMLNFRAFMVLNVLDYVALWAMLRFDGVVINSSSNIYAISSGGGGNERPLNQWTYLNGMFQAKPHKQFIGFSGKVLEYFQYPVSMSGQVIPGLDYLVLLGVSAHHRSETSSPWMGSTNFLNGRVPPRGKNVVHNTSTTFSSSPTLSYQSITGDSYGDVIVGKEVASFNNSSGNLISSSGHTGGPFTYPDRFINHGIGLPQAPVPASTLPNLLTGPAGIATTDKLLNGIVTAFNRTNIIATTTTGSIKHYVPYPEAGKPKGVTIAPLQFSQVHAYGGDRNHINLHETFGNLGDSLYLPRAVGTAYNRVQYVIMNRSSSAIPITYRVYLKVATVGTATFKIWYNFLGGATHTIDTSSNHEGFQDNNRFYKYLDFGTFVLAANTDNTLDIEIAGGSVDIGQIILAPANKVPIYV